MAVTPTPGGRPCFASSTVRCGRVGTWPVDARPLALCIVRALPKVTGLERRASDAEFSIYVFARKARRAAESTVGTAYSPAQRTTAAVPRCKPSRRYNARTLPECRTVRARQALGGEAG